MKHLVWLYPKRWRARYGAEIAGIVARQRISLEGMVDLLRGALDAHLHPSLASQPVFVPAIGFRPGGTRALLERAETVDDETHLTVIAVAAGPDRTDVEVEWKRTGHPVTCPPDSHVLSPLPSGSMDPAVTAALVVGMKRLEAITPMARSAYSSSSSEILAAQTIGFPPLPDGADSAELVVADGEHRWRVPFTVGPGNVRARPLTVQAANGGIVVRATAIAWHGDKLVVAVEAEAPQHIRMVAAPVPTAHAWRGNDEDVEAKTAELRRVFSERSRPIALEDDHGRRVEEQRRLFSRDPQRTVSGEPYISRFAVVFDTPSADATSATLVVPFVDLLDREPSVTVDLRDVPVEVALGEHRFRVVSADQYGPDERRVVVEIPRSDSPQFVQPSRIQGIPSRPGFSWSGPDEKPFWMATAVGDPPIVRFEGAVLRVTGPWRLPIPLA